MLKKIKISLTIFISLLLLAVIALNIQKTSAAAVYKKTCTLFVLPYNPSPSIQDTIDDNNTDVDEVAPYTNYLDDSCSQHITYGNKYMPQLPIDVDNPIKPGSIGIRAPIAKHEHAYVNDSDHTIPNNLYFYKAAMDKFEITVQSDGNNNLYTNNITCDTQVPLPYRGNASDLEDCNGYVKGLFGGTRVSKTQGPNNTTIIKWEFAQDPEDLQATPAHYAHSGRPYIYGNNGSSFTVYKSNGTTETLNLTNPYDRMFTFGVNLPTKNNAGQLWSATTSSRALIADLAIAKANASQNFGKSCLNPANVSDPINGWCYAPIKTGYTQEPVVTSTGTYNYYWYQIASVGTVWKKPPLPTLRLVKNVINDNGGTATYADFPLYINNLKVNSGVLTAMEPGTYRARETNKDGYQAGPWGGNCSPDGTVTLNYGDNKICSITNDDIPPLPPAKLTLIKTIVNGGPLQVKDVVMKITGPSSASTVPIAISGTPYTLPAGAYTVSETTNRTDYTTTGWTGDCSADGKITLNSNDNKTCTITNTYVPPTVPQAKLTLIKTIVNGGPLQVKDVVMTITGSSSASTVPIAISGTPYTLPAGEYTISETTNRTDYTTAGWTAPCSADGKITLSPGDNKTCTITNTYVPPPPQQAALTLTKIVNGGGTSPDDFKMSINKNDSPVVPWAKSGSAYPLAPGSYVVREQQQPNYTTSGWTGGCNADGTVTLNAGENKACTITNTYVSGGGGGGGGGGRPTAIPCTDLQIEPATFVPNVSIPQVFTARVNPTNFTGSITWTHVKGGRIVSTPQAVAGGNSRMAFSNLSPDSKIIASAAPVNPANTCSRQAVAEPVTIRRQPAGELTKTSLEINSRGNVIKKNQTSEFKITFTPNAPVPSLNIKDSMQKVLKGSEGGEITLVRGAMNGKDFRIQRRGGGSFAAIQKCPVLFSPSVQELCYEGDPLTSQGITIKNINDETIVITYQGKLAKSNITKDYCKNLSRDFCGEKFTNTAQDSLGNSAKDTLYTPCPFLFTQGIGDIILSTDLRAGSDIASCAGIPNIEGPVIKPQPPEQPRTPRTGAGEILNIPPHTLCQQSNTENPDLPQAYRNPIKSLSSSICELSLSLADILTPPKIRADVTENITRLTRNNNNLGEGDKTVYDLNAPQLAAGQTNPNPNYEIYKLKNGSLTIQGNQRVSKGARTYVIENGDLVINGNINYEDTPFDLANIKDIPQIAFVVINGSIKIAPHVTHLSGVFVALKGEGSSARLNSGKVLGTADSEQMLVFEGSIYGDIEELFESRSFSGNARQGQGTIVINYDGRLFYSVPPGLQEILDVSQEQVAR